jgi:prefoldin subunit 5
MYPLARDGFTLSVHRFFGDIYSVVMDYRAYGDKNRIWLNLEGVEAISNQKIQGRFEILAATDNAAVLIEREGVKQVVSRTEPLHIYPGRVSIEIGKPVRITTQEIDMRGRNLGEIPRFPNAHRVLFYGHLTPARFASLSIHQERFNAISRSLDKIKLDHAEYRGIQAQNLQNLLIRDGVLVARICSEPKARVSNTDHLVPVQPAERIRVVEFRIDPSDRVLFEVGDVVAVGQAIARADISAKLEDLESDSEQELERLTHELQEVQQELTGTRNRLTRKRHEKSRIEEELNRLSKEPLFGKDRVRLRRARVMLEKEAAQLQKKIADLHRKITQLEEERFESMNATARERVRLGQKAALRSSFSGKILRIDRQPEGERIRLSVLYQQAIE